MAERRILFVFAHPDDESYGAGGTIAKYASQGVHIHLVTATDGENSGFGRTRADSLAVVRRAELDCAASVLGIQGLQLLHYPDGALCTVPSQELRSRIASIIEQESPDVLVTFAPHGISGHPDHRCVSLATTEAFREVAGDNLETGRMRLFYLTIPRSWLNTLPWLLSLRMRRRWHGTPDARITTEIDISEFAEKKKAACRCHESQWTAFHRVNRFVGEKYFNREYYVHANESQTSFRAAGLTETDFFQ